MKRKAWDITVKDNPNRVVMGENDEFYTTDTEAFLVFNLQDKDFVPQSAMITLENRNDGSLKSEEVEVVGSNITWEMPERYIEHSGNWQAQLVYEQMKGATLEKYTSGVMAFTVNSHIKDKKKPSLVEVENWEKFVRDGAELIETWEDMEDLREANEAQRQANYQELLDTGVLQTNINTKLEALEEEYAPKLTEVTAQLAQTIRLDESNLSLNNFKEHDRAIIQGLAEGEINAVLGYENVTNLNVAANAVSVEKADFISKSSNLYNPKKSEEGKIIDASGNVIDHHDYVVSDYISVSPNTIYSFGGGSYIACFDENLSFIRRYSLPTTNTFTIPNDIYYIRLNILKRENFVQINKGEILLPYSEYYLSLDEDISVSGKGLQITRNEIVDGEVTPSKTSFLKASSNLFDVDTIERGKVISATGDVIENVTYVTSDYIPVEGDVVYSSTGISYISYYDENKSFMSRTATSTESEISFTTLPNARYIRLSLNLNANHVNLMRMQLNKGELQHYEPYGYTLANGIKGVEKKLEDYRPFVISGKTDYREQTELPGREKFWFSSDVYDFFDGLVTDYPEYVSKEEVGTSVSGKPIYRYDFKPTPVATPHEVPIPKQIITLGTHGPEKMTFEVVRHMLNQLCRNWQDDEMLETLRWNVHFIVIALVNPDGWDSINRKNDNLVDINRNFPTDWSQGDPESNTYGGSQPLSEPEARAVKKVIDEERENVIAITDIHNFSTRENPNNFWEFIWVAIPPRSYHSAHLTSALVKDTSKSWKKRYAFLPQDEVTYFGHSSSLSGGTIANYGTSLGIPSVVFETSQSLPYANEESYGPVAVTLATEAFINWLLLNLEHNIDLLQPNLM